MARSVIVQEEGCHRAVGLRFEDVDCLICLFEEMLICEVTVSVFAGLKKQSRLTVILRVRNKRNNRKYLVARTPRRRPNGPIPMSKNQKSSMIPLRLSALVWVSLSCVDRRPADDHEKRKLIYRG
jgi:hypothetical protein